MLQVHIEVLVLMFDTEVGGVGRGAELTQVHQKPTMASHDEYWIRSAPWPF